MPHYSVLTNVTCKQQVRVTANDERTAREIVERGAYQVEDVIENVVEKSEVFNVTDLSKVEVKKK